MTKLFSGIVETIGTLVSLDKGDDTWRISVKIPFSSLGGLIPSASISVEGVCLTIVKIEGDVVHFDLIPETLRCTTLSQKNVGDPLNIERSLKIGDEIGGHLLSGHINAKGIIEFWQKNTKSAVCVIRCEDPSLPVIFSKGYIAVDGISLTVGHVDPLTDSFHIHLIPETLERTTLGEKSVGDLVNLEFDGQTIAVVQTVERLLAEKGVAC